MIELEVGSFTLMITLSGLSCDFSLKNPLPSSRVIV